MRENEYASVERVLLLMVLLSNGTYTRAEVFETIPVYGPATSRATHRMFDRDIACLERLGFHVEREMTGKFVLYRIARIDSPLNI